MSSISSPDSISSLYVARKTVDVYKQHEQNRVESKRTPWSAYDSPLDEYNESFLGVLPDGGVAGLILQLRKAKGTGINALEIAGQGNVLLHLKRRGIKKIETVSLNDFRGTLRRVSERIRGLRYIDGDITNGTTWARISKQSKDLIMSRPMAALSVLRDPNLGFVLLNRMYTLLAPNGTLLIQLPEELIGITGTAWIEKLATTEGIEVKYRGNETRRAIYSDRYQPILLIKRKDNSPKDLSFLREVNFNPQSRVSILN